MAPLRGDFLVAGLEIIFVHHEASINIGSVVLFMMYSIGEPSMMVFKFKPIGFMRAVLSGLFYFILFYLMLRYGFKDTDNALRTSLAAGLTFGFMFWFAMSMLGEGGVVNKVCQKFMSKN